MGKKILPSINLKTPGVYINEISAFPNAVQAAETAVPAFVGYTQKAERAGESLLNEAVKISSLAEFVQLFGEPLQTHFTLFELTDENKQEVVYQKGDQAYGLQEIPHTTSLLYRAIQFFYANGGVDCYIVSVGLFAKATADSPATVPVGEAALIEGISVLEKEEVPSMLLVPEAVQLSEEAYQRVNFKMLEHSGSTKSRIAILDVRDGYLKENSKGENVIDRFRKLNSAHFSYGCAYYPWLETTIVQSSEMTAAQISNLKEVLGDDKDAATGILSAALKRINTLPPGPAMAGVMARLDVSQGVWRAPANVGITGVVSPTVAIDNVMQEDLNVDQVAGKSVNAIRSFPGQGTLVWGARTLDGNSLEWRYLNARRLMMMIEQSVQRALTAYAFEPNIDQTWVSVKSMVTNFLTALWKQGALAGATPDDAFQVRAGLNETMTAADLNLNILRVEMHVAVVRPAEFIVLEFAQEVQRLAE